MRHLCSIIALLLAQSLPLCAANLSMSVIDVGQGDSILVDFPNDQHMLVDAGMPEAGRTVVKYLKAHQVTRIDILVATHPHEDHIGGMLDVLAAFPVGKVWDSGFNQGSGIQRRFLQTINTKHIPYGNPCAGFSQTIGDARIDVLAPVRLLSGTNNNSIVMCISYGTTSFLLTGDMEGAERATVEHWPQCTVLKVAHHGSRNGTDEAFAQAVHPQYAVISYGVGNKYDHSVVNALASVSAKLYSTGQMGTVVITSDGRRVSVSTAGKLLPLAQRHPHQPKRRQGAGLIPRAINATHRSEKE